MKRLIPILAVLLVVVSLLELVLPVKVYDHHPWWRGLPGLYGLFGAAGCGLLVLVAKSLGKLLLVPEPDPALEDERPIDPAQMEEGR